MTKTIESLEWIIEQLEMKEIQYRHTANYWAEKLQKATSRTKEKYTMENNKAAADYEGIHEKLSVFRALLDAEKEKHV